MLQNKQKCSRKKEKKWEINYRKCPARFAAENKNWQCIIGTQCMLNIQLLQSFLLWQIKTPADMRGKLWTVWRGCTAFSLAPWWGGIIHETMNSMKRLYCIFSYPMMGRDNSWNYEQYEEAVLHFLLPHDGEG